LKEIRFVAEAEPEPEKKNDKKGKKPAHTQFNAE